MTVRLLLVDDEPHILSALHRSLRREGWELVLAGSPDEAIAAFEAAPFTAILSDHKMPGSSGLELLDRAAAIRPGTPAALLTGWPEEIPPAELERLGIRALIPKPWDDAELKRHLRGLVATGNVDLPL